MSEQPIHVLMPKVMADIGAIGKGRTNTHQGFKFRGIDDVMNALHEPLTKHGVFYVPEVLETEYTTYTTNNGTGMRNCVLRVKYTFYGPAGDSIAAIGAGEASDSGDKATSKALAMALKYALLHGFCIPTEEMGAEDPDGSAHTRAGGWSDNGPSCPTCGTDVWDNTQDPKRGNRPKWKCKDANCDWASWDDDPFSETAPQTPDASLNAPAPSQTESAEAIHSAGSTSPWYAEYVEKYGPVAFCRAATKFAKSGAVTDPKVTEQATPEQRDAIIKELAESDFDRGAKQGALS